MSVSQRPAKRQCFSIESLAVSSHVEKQDLSRDTDSPYLHYIHSKGSEINNNFQMNEVNNSVQQQVINLYRRCENGADLVTNNPLQNVFFSAVSTSTPISLPVKRRRICSGSSTTSPTTSEDERQFTDMSLTSESTEDEKLSISSSTTSSVTSDPDLDSCIEDSGSKRKKVRTAFTGEQLRELEKRYKNQKYLSASDRSQLARSLRLKDQQVKTWFQNRRMKEKRQQKEDEHSNGFSFPTGGVDIAHLAALGICPPPHVGNMLGTPSTYNNQATRSTNNSEQGAQESLKSSSPVYSAPSTNIISNALYMDRMAFIHRQSQLLPTQFALSPSSATHPMMHYGISAQLSPSLQIGKRS